MSYVYTVLLILLSPLSFFRTGAWDSCEGAAIMVRREVDRRAPNWRSIPAAGALISPETLARAWHEARARTIESGDSPGLCLRILVGPGDRAIQRAEGGN